MMQNNPEFSRGIEVVSSAIIRNKKGKIFLMRSPKWSNKWALPGGHIDSGESIFDATVREVKEETGLIIKVDKILIANELINSKDFFRPAHFVYFDCICKLLGGRVKLQKREATEYLWVEIEDSFKLDLADSFLETLQEYYNYIAFERVSAMQMGVRSSI